MTNGKPAGVPCIHLDDQMRCKIFNHPDRPVTCYNYKAEIQFCGNTREEAFKILDQLENG